jgi:divalent metal cation (Fe/Co/Zn/Cd) transporter
VNMNVDFQDDLQDAQLEKIIDGLEERIRRAVPEVDKIFIEADTVTLKPSRCT